MNATTFDRLRREQARSGLSIAAFCRKQGIALSTFHYWRKRKADPADGPFVELRLGQATVSSPPPGSALAENVFGQNPTSGHLFVFVNRQKNRAKMLLWERGGFWLMSRRLEQGTFALPQSAPGGTLTVDRVQWAMFLDGVMAENIRHKKRYFPVAESAV